MIPTKRSVPFLLGLILTLGACTSGAVGSSSQPAEATEPAVESTVPAEPVPAEPASTEAVVVPDTVGVIEASQAEVPPAAEPVDQITNDGVLAAAVIIVSDGDLEAAIADGIVTEAEADAAIAALEAGTLSDYQD